MSIITLKNLRVVVVKLLSEGRVEDLKKQFPDLNVELYSQRDPSPTKKYLSWMIKQVLAGASKNDLFPTIQYFHKNLSRFTNKDINSYKTLKDLENAVKSVSEKKSSKEKRTEVKSSAETLFEDDEFVLVHVGSKESCQLYGSGTKWCITMKDASYYEDYTMSNVVFYFLLRKQSRDDSFDKIAFAVQRNNDNTVMQIEIFDAEDIEVTGTRKLINSVTVERFSKVNKIMMSDAPKRPKSLLAKVIDKEATPNEQHEAWNIYSRKSSANIDILRLLIEQFTDQDLLIKIFKTRHEDDGEIGQALAANTSLNQGTLSDLARSHDYYIVATVANNSSTSEETLDSLSMSPHEIIRCGVAKNERTSEGALISLSLDKETGVRTGVAQNESAPPAILDILARTPAKGDNLYVLLSVARNPSASSKTLKYLVDEDISALSISSIAAGNLRARQK